jgi:hypothetical protein
VAKRTDQTVEELVGRHFDSDGRLTVLPAKPARRLLVLRRIAEQFPVEVESDEFAVNKVLRPIDDDVATLRRYLVDERLLDRTSPGRYIRRGIAEA